MAVHARGDTLKGNVWVCEEEANFALLSQTSVTCGRYRRFVDGGCGAQVIGRGRLSLAPPLMCSTL